MIDRDTAIFLKYHLFIYHLSNFHLYIDCVYKCVCVYLFGNIGGNHLLSSLIGSFRYLFKCFLFPDSAVIVHLSMFYKIKRFWFALFCLPSLFPSLFLILCGMRGPGWETFSYRSLIFTEENWLIF